MHDRALDFVRILKIFRKLVPDAYEALVMRLNVVVVPAGAAVFHFKKKTYGTLPWCGSGSTGRRERCALYRDAKAPLLASPLS